MTNLVGRGDEISWLTQFVQNGVSDGAASLLIGDMGVGKTRLLEEGIRIAEASGCRVLRLSGIEFEAELSYAGLHQIVAPFMERLTLVPREHHRALTAALGLAVADDPTPGAVFAATHALLQALSRLEPLFIAIDDLQWVDPASVAALTFVARRVSGARIGLIAAVRSEVGTDFRAASGIRAQWLTPLDRDHSSELLRSTHPQLQGSIAERVLDEAGGNPLAIIELANAVRRLPPAQFGDHLEILPVPVRLTSFIRRRIAELPDGARRLLLLLALDGAHVRNLVSEDDLKQLGYAEKAGIVKIDLPEGSVRFQHPLFRSAVVASATATERRDAHMRIAERLDHMSHRRVWHLSEAAIEPDESLAAALERAARDFRARGDAVTATNWLRRAAVLTPSLGDRRRRLASAAYLGAWVTGDHMESSTILFDAQAVPRTRASPLEAVAQALLSLDGARGGSGAHTSILQAEANGAFREVDEDDLAEAMDGWFILCWQRGSESGWREYLEVLGRYFPDDQHPLRVRADAFADTVRTGASARKGMLDMAARLVEERDGGKIIVVSTATFYLDLISACRPALGAIIAEGRRGTPTRTYARALANIALDDFARGNWSKAEDLVTEGLGSMREPSPWYFEYLLALVAAVRGDVSASSLHADELDRIARRTGAPGIGRFSPHPRALAAAGQSDWESVYRHAIQLGPPGEFPSFSPHALWVAYDLVEAAVRTSRVDEAKAHHAAMDEARIADISPRLALLSTGAAALVMEGPEALDAFERAVWLDDAHTWPFDLARVQLAYGERLRRESRPGRARETLHAALEAFTVLGAHPWAARARAELRASGEATSASPPLRSTARLTAQERAIAELAADGLSNKAIGSRLYLSPRTVSGHLYRVFPKLGITARSQLHRALHDIDSRDHA